MANEKLLRGTVSILAARPEAFVDLATPTAAELNGPLVYDVSCAILDDYTLNQTDSDTDDTRTICDVGQVSTPTFRNYEAALDGLRDADLAADGYYNRFFNLFKSKDIPYVLVKRIGPVQGTAFAAGQVVSLFSVDTDNPIDIVEDGTPIAMGARFKARGGVNINYTLEA